jgi:hypothetical protein
LLRLDTAYLPCAPPRVFATAIYTREDAQLEVGPNTALQNTKTENGFAKRNRGPPGPLRRVRLVRRVRPKVSHVKVFRFVLLI